LRGVNEFSTNFGIVARRAPLARKRRGEHSCAGAAQRRGDRAENVIDDDKTKTRAAIERLKEEHRDLDAAIDALHRAGDADQLQMQRLKKRKLALRDQLAALFDALTPDIIA